MPGGNRCQLPTGFQSYAPLMSASGRLKLILVASANVTFALTVRMPGPCFFSIMNRSTALSDGWGVKKPVPTSLRISPAAPLSRNAHSPVLARSLVVAETGEYLLQTRLLPAPAAFEFQLAACATPLGAGASKPPL